MADPKSSYLELELCNPVIVSAGPLSQSVEDIKALADAGLGAVTMFSLFGEQLLWDAEHLVELGEQLADVTPKATSFFPEVPRTEADTVTNYLRLVEKDVQAIDVPLVTSLNDVSHGGWVHSAHSLQDAGAAALEPNIYYVPGDLTLGGEEVERRHLDILRVVKSEVNIPVAVRLSPYFSSVDAMRQRLDRAGADGLVLFDRFPRPDIDLDWLEVVNGVTLNSPMDARLPYAWIAMLRDHVEAPLAASSGVDQSEDAVEHLLVGADAVCTTSALVRHGVEHATRLAKDLESWLDGGRLTLGQARGMLAVPGRTPAGAYERAGYVTALEKAETTYRSLS